MTAWHCILYCNTDPDQMNCSAVFNDYERHKDDKNEYSVKIAHIERFGKDLGVAQLDEIASYFDEETNEKILQETVEISKLIPEPGTIVTAAGYGMKGHGKYSYFLRSVKLEVLDKNPDVDGLLETRVGENNEDPCAGDSGGPMLIGEEGNWKLVATVSGGGYDCRFDNTTGNQLWNLVPGVVVDEIIKCLNENV